MIEIGTKCKHHLRAHAPRPPPCPCHVPPFLDLFLVICGCKSHPRIPLCRPLRSKVDSGVTLVKFKVLFGTPWGALGTSFSDLRRSRAATNEKTIQKLWLHSHNGPTSEFCAERVLT